MPRHKARRFVNPVRRFFTLPRVEVFAAVIAMTISLLSLTISTCSRPPSSEPILQIIETEATAALERDIDKAINLFAEDAFVRDALGEAGKKLGVVLPQEPTSWSGLKEIRQRYANLPRFTTLSHLGVVVTFDDTKRLAKATASTNGVYESDTGTPAHIFSIDGERWTFAKIDGVWKITSFSYNVP